MLDAQVLEEELTVIQDEHALFTKLGAMVLPVKTVI